MFDCRRPKHLMSRCNTSKKGEPFDCQGQEQHNYMYFFHYLIQRGHTYPTDDDEGGRLLSERNVTTCTRSHRLIELLALPRGRPLPLKVSPQQSDGHHYSTICLSITICMRQASETREDVYCTLFILNVVVGLQHDGHPLYVAVMRPKPICRYPRKKVELDV